MNNERGDITDTLNKCCRNLLSKIGCTLQIYTPHFYVI